MFVCVVISLQQVRPGVKMPPPVQTERRMSVVGSRSNPEKFLGQDYHQLHRDFYDNRARFWARLGEVLVIAGLLSHTRIASRLWVDFAIPDVAFL